MKKKSDRLQTIRRIIADSRISSQEELLRRLQNKGFNLTQATLSRDLKFLQVAKVAGGGDGYVYVLPGVVGSEVVARDPDRMNFLEEGFRGIQFSGNLSVIKTLPGYASTLAAVIDNAGLWEIIGSLAGDDTILLILKEGVTRNDLKAALKRHMPFLKDKL